MRILAIETSCDETAFAVVKASGGKSKPHFVVEKNLITSQIKVHRPWGGVVPNLAKREHIKNLPKMFKALKLSKDLKEIDAIAVTVGPGLAPALWQGVEFAKKLAEENNKKLLGVNHLEGHLYSTFLPKEGEAPPKTFPIVGLSVSGGHSNIILLKDLLNPKKIGNTRDDAAGEAFDKVGKMLGLPYPGGPEVEKLAKEGNSEAIEFPRPMINDDNFEFSFSGLKTAVLYYLRDLKKNNKRLTKKRKADICASFQAAVIDVLVKKTAKAAKKHKAKGVFVCGGVSANKAVQKAFVKMAKEFNIPLYIPEKSYNTDNAAMIAAAAYMNTLKKKNYKIEAQAQLTIT